MKIQLDTTTKIIKLESSENLGELIEKLKELLPDGLWKEFKLETNTTIHYLNPIIWRDIYVEPYRPYIPIIQPYVTTIQPYTQPYIPNIPWITYCGSGGNCVDNTPSLISGVYNIEA